MSDHRRNAGTGGVFRRKALLSCLLWIGLCGAASAMQAGAGAAATPASGPGQAAEAKLVTRSTLGAWMLREDAARPGLNCAVKFVPARAGAVGLAILGPTTSSRASSILFDGYGIPSSRSPQQVQVELVQKDLPVTRLNAMQLPGDAASSAGVLAIPAGDIRQTLKSMRDREDEMQLKLVAAPTVSVAYDGLDQARGALLACLDGKRFVGKSLREATAELRPLGASTIRGQTFFKGALLAKKKYPPKGSRAVGLIWMTDEFKVWYEQVKRNKKLPEQIPLQILKHFMSTRILDDEGRWEFTNMPAGEYLLVANFSYEKIVNRPEVVGRTDVYRGNQYIGSNDQVAYWSYAVQEGTTFEKKVIVPRDGDTIDVALDKSQIYCFIVCF